MSKISVTNAIDDLALAVKLYDAIAPQLTELGVIISKLKTNLTVADIVQLQAETEDAKRENEVSLDNAKKREKTV